MIIQSKPQQCHTHSATQQGQHEQRSICFYRWSWFPVYLFNSDTLHCVWLKLVSSMQRMSNMVNIFTGITRVNTNNLCIRCRLEFLRSLGLEKCLRSRNESREIDSLAQCRYLCNRLKRTFTKNRKETFELSALAYSISSSLTDNVKLKSL